MDEVVNEALQSMKITFMGWENCDTMEKYKM